MYYKHKEINFIMKELLKYQESNYFNEKDTYLFHTNLKRFYVSKVHFYNGAWYTDVGCKYKATTVLSINTKELFSLEVTYIGTELRGKMTKFMSPDNVGVNWYQGQKFKLYGLPYFWNIAENLK